MDLSSSRDVSFPCWDAPALTVVTPKPITLSVSWLPVYANDVNKLQERGHVAVLLGSALPTLFHGFWQNINMFAYVNVLKRASAEGIH